MRLGKMIRSAKMNAITLPKLIPPFLSIAASETLPMEHTKLTTATIGPTSGPYRPPSTGWSVRKTSFQRPVGNLGSQRTDNAQPRHL